MAYDGVELVRRFGRICQKYEFQKVLRFFRNPCEKMRLDETFRTVPVSCQLEVVVKSYGQITEIISWNHFRQNVEEVGSIKM